MHPEGLVAEAVDRLRAASLIPPVGGIEMVGSEEDESVLVTVRGPVTADLRTRVAEVLTGVPYELREVSPTHGMVFGTGEGSDGSRDRG